MPPWVYHSRQPLSRRISHTMPASNAAAMKPMATSPMCMRVRCHHVSCAGTSTSTG